MTNNAADGTIVGALVPMIHVLDVDRSVAFYRLLGFEIGNYVPREGPVTWVWLYAPGARDWKRGPNLMLTKGGKTINAQAQEVLFYLYAADLPALRAELLSAGMKPGDIDHPEYLPDGEFRISDPDGYTLMIAQAGPDTP